MNDIHHTLEELWLNDHLNDEQFKFLKILTEKESIQGDLWTANGVPSSYRCCCPSYDPEMSDIQRMKETDTI